MLFWLSVGLGIFTGMCLLCCLVYLVFEAIVARDEDDERIRKYMPRHADGVPRAEPDPWAAILRPPAPSGDPGPPTVRFRALTDSGALRMIDATTNAWIAEHISGEES